MELIEESSAGKALGKPRALGTCPCCPPALLPQSVLRAEGPFLDQSQLYLSVLRSRCSRYSVHRDCVFLRIWQFDYTPEGTCCPPATEATVSHGGTRLPLRNTPACVLPCPRSSSLLQTSQQNHSCFLKFASLFCSLNSPFPLGSQPSEVHTVSPWPAAVQDPFPRPFRSQAVRSGLAKQEHLQPSTWPCISLLKHDSTGSVQDRED